MILKWICQLVIWNLKQNFQKDTKIKRSEFKLAYKLSVREQTYTEYQLYITEVVLNSFVYIM